MRRDTKTIFQEKLGTLSLPVLDSYREEFLTNSFFLIRLKFGKDNYKTIRQYPPGAFTQAWSRYLYWLDWYTSLVIVPPAGVSSIKLQFVYILKDKTEFYKYVFHSVKLCVKTPYELKTPLSAKNRILTNQAKYLKRLKMSVLRKNLYKFPAESV